MTIDEMFRRRDLELPGWIISLHEKSEFGPARVALMSPDGWIEYGGEDESLLAAFSKALAEARARSK